ncbi:hypothetical protein TNCV_1382471 [Trichonephila clavipes]|nr:hypothetical protein TNCV_1382471 [Trichonephila clavipes]
MPTSAPKDLFKKWVDVRAMILEWHPNQADVSKRIIRRQDNPDLETSSLHHFQVWRLALDPISRFGD